MISLRAHIKAILITGGERPVYFLSEDHVILGGRNRSGPLYIRLSRRREWPGYRHATRKEMSACVF